jgi:hypothetical protein
VDTAPSPSRDRDGPGTHRRAREPGGIGMRPPGEGEADIDTPTAAPTTADVSAEYDDGTGLQGLRPGLKATDRAGGLSPKKQAYCIRVYHSS